MSTIRRSCVTPKLVSKGWSSCMRSSRISIRFMNTRRSWNKDVFAPLIASLEVGDVIIIRDVLQKLFTNALLDLARRFQALLFQRLDISRYGHSAFEVLYVSDHPGASRHPSCIRRGAPTRQVAPLLEQEGWPRLKGAAGVVAPKFTVFDPPLGNHTIAVHSSLPDTGSLA